MAGLTAGVGLFPTGPAPLIIDQVRLADELGFSSVWIGDSQNLWREATTILGGAAVATSRVRLGSGVTNAVTRHRSVIASSWVTLQELSHGRAVLGIGTGDSSLRTMGLSPMKLRDLESAIDQFRRLFSGEQIVEPSSQTEFHLSYLSAPIHVPIYIAASAPRILELAGRVADGVIVLAGTRAPLINAALSRIQDGASTSGRTLDDLQIVLWTPTAVSDDPAVARSLVRSHVARVAIRPLPAPVTDDQQGNVERIRSTYDYYQHMDTSAHHAAEVSDELVGDYALAGTAAQCRERLQEIATTAIDEIAMVPYVSPGELREDALRSLAELVASI